MKKYIFIILILSIAIVYIVTFNQGKIQSGDSQYWEMIVRDIPYSCKIMINKSAAFKDKSMAKGKDAAPKLAYG
jgi:hypothetical protein